MTGDAAMPASPGLRYYWGEGGQYGPFDVQVEGEWAGWPDCGQVLRYFRKRAGLTAKAFGVRYGAAINADGSPVSERRILDMELENKVPVDINKRKIIARLLNIPPLLFGLAVLQEMKLEPHAQAAHLLASEQTSLSRISIDTTTYHTTLTTLWQLHETSSAFSSFGQVQASIARLASFEQQSQGDLRYHVQELLLSYQILATHIVRDQRQFQRAYEHANAAVRVARDMHDHDLLATALFTRGWTRLEWGLFGRMQQGMFQVQQDKLSAGIHDFEAALHLFPSQHQMHPQLFGLVSVFLARARATLATSQGERTPVSVLLTLDDIASSVNCQNIDDPYTRVLITGTRTGLHKAGYLDTRAVAFNVAGLPGQALRELNELENLTEKAYRRDETRQFTWLDILKANIYMEMKEYAAATTYARQALIACLDISSVTNTAIITDIYSRLRNSSYGTSGDVKELGDLLRSAQSLQR